jgi:hypothetical protein
MVILFNKKKEEVTQMPPEAVVEAKPAETTKTALAELVDEYVETKAAVEKLKKDPLFAKLKQLEESLRNEIGPIPEDQTQIVKGNIHEVELGMASMVRTITNMSKILEFVGLESFLKSVTFPLGDVDKYLTEEQKAEVLECARTGSRSIKVLK